MQGPTRRLLAAGSVSLAILAALAPGGQEEVVHFPAATGEESTPLTLLLGARADQAGVVVLYGDSVLGSAAPEPVNTLLQPVEVPVAEGLTFLEALCAEEGLYLGELGVGSFRFLTVDYYPLGNYSERALDVPAAELGLWRHRPGVTIRTELEVEGGWSPKIHKVLRDLTFGNRNATVEFLAWDGAPIVLSGRGSFVHELGRLVEELRPGRSPVTGSAPPDFFPPATAGFALPPVETPITLQELLQEVSAVTGQNFLCSRRERRWLEKARVDHGGREFVPPEEVWSFLEGALRSEHFSLAEVRRREPRLMSVGRQSGTDYTRYQWALARLVAAEHLDALAEHPALLLRCPIRIEPWEAVVTCEHALEVFRGFAEEVEVSALVATPGALIVTGIVPDLLEARRIVEAETAAWKRKQETDEKGD